MIVLGADYAGYDMKEYIKGKLVKRGEDVVDVSPVKKDRDDYPDHVRKAVKEMKKRKGSRGVFICGTGVGVTMAANRYRGIRAALLLDRHTARTSRQINDINVACLRGWGVSKSKALKLVDIFLKTSFEKLQRRVRRNKKLG